MGKLLLRGAIVGLLVLGASGCHNCLHWGHGHGHLKVPPGHINNPGRGH